MKKKNAGAMLETFANCINYLHGIANQGTYYNSYDRAALARFIRAACVPFCSIIQAGHGE